MKKNYVIIFVSILVILLVVQATMSMRKKSVTVDEIMYIAAGYYHIETGDFQMNMTNPPLMKLLSAFPLVFIDLKIPVIDGNTKDWSLIKQWQFARRFLYENTVDADKILFLARLPIVFISVLLGFYVFKLSKDLYGEKAGLFSLFLYCLSPNILAHSRLATHDLGLTAFMFISSYYFWRSCRIPESKNYILCGLFFGCAMLTKTTALFLLPIFAIYVFIIFLKRRPPEIYKKLNFIYKTPEKSKPLRHLASVIIVFLFIGIIGITVLNVGYGFQGTFEPIPIDNPSRVYQKLPVNNTATRSVVDLLLKIPLPLPSPYLEMVKFQRSLTNSSGNVYFAGKIYNAGLWYLMIITFLIKSPIPFLIILTLSLISLFHKFRQLDAEWLMISFVCVVMGLFSYMSNINMGLRYVLPIFPFLHVLASRIIIIKFRRTKLAGTTLTLLAGWYLISSVSTHPHYLAYFNELIGGSKNSYKYLVDSNLDWGQDLKGLKDYMDEKGIDKIKLAYFGSADANYYGINYDYLPSVGLTPKEPGQYWWYEIDENHRYEPGPQKGMIAISATLLASPGWLKSKLYDTYQWLREHEPVDQIGYSILIYDIH